tara:strand:+ start:5386 stop:6078 length:693 start_codon:yes stop_codon:yes gene_type:complete
MKGSYSINEGVIIYENDLVTACKYTHSNLINGAYYFRLYEKTGILVQFDINLKLSDVRPFDNNLTNANDIYDPIKDYDKTFIKQAKSIMIMLKLRNLNIPKNKENMTLKEQLDNIEIIEIDRNTRVVKYPCGYECTFIRKSDSIYFRDNNDLEIIQKKMDNIIEHTVNFDGDRTSFSTLCNELNTYTDSNGNYWHRNMEIEFPYEQQMKMAKVFVDLSKIQTNPYFEDKT